MKRLFLFIASLLTLSSFAQTKMELAQQAMDNDDYLTVIQYTTEQLKETPKDVKVLAMRTIAFLAQEDYSSALVDANMAVKCWNKNCGIALGNLYCLCGLVYENAEQYESALNEYNTAIKKDKKNPKCYEARALLYYKHKMFAEAEADYRKAYELDQSGTDKAVEVARCLVLQNKQDEATQMLDYIIKYEPKNAEALRLRAAIYFYVGDLTSTIDYYTTYLSIEPQEDLEILLSSAASEYAYALKIVSGKIKNAENDDYRLYWLGVRARIHQVKEQYQDALKDLQTMQAMQTDTATNSFILYQTALCYYELYEFDEAAKCYTKLIDASNAENFPSELYLERGYCYDYMGNYELAISDYSKVIDEDIDYASVAYYGRGLAKYVLKDYDGALEDYNKGLLLDETDLYLRINRGRLLLLQKQDSIRANIDFEYVLARDTIPQNSIRHYALLYSGKASEAAEWMNKVLENDPSAGKYYDAACLYARMNRPDDAIRYLKTSLEMGYRGLVHLEADDDLDSLRERQDYKNLIIKYKQEKISSLFHNL